MRAMLIYRSRLAGVNTLLAALYAMTWLICYSQALLRYMPCFSRHATLLYLHSRKMQLAAHGASYLYLLYTEMAFYFFIGEHFR
jgi:hypothetical protein